MTYKNICGDRSNKGSEPDVDAIRKADLLPGDRILAYRKAAGLTQRALASKCDPPMDFSAIGRIEKNRGYTSSTLNRLANALECEVSDFFLPFEMVLWRQLSATDQLYVRDIIQRFWQTGKPYE